MRPESVPSVIGLLNLSVPENVLVSLRADEDAAVMVCVSPRLNSVPLMVKEEFCRALLGKSADDEAKPYKSPLLLPTNPDERLVKVSVEVAVRFAKVEVAEMIPALSSKAVEVADTLSVPKVEGVKGKVAPEPEPHVEPLAEIHPPVFTERHPVVVVASPGQSKPHVEFMGYTVFELSFSKLPETCATAKVGSAIPTIRSSVNKSFFMKVPMANLMLLAHRWQSPLPSPRTCPNLLLGSHRSHCPTKGVKRAPCGSG